METYTETVYRYQILKHEELPEAHKAALRARDIDPDTRWTLYMSFNNETEAMEMTGHLQDDAADWETYKFVDGGETKQIERPVW